MRYSEASWHTHTAAHRAEVSAEATLEPAVRLAAAAQPGTTVCGVYFEPITAGGLIAIQSVYALAARSGHALTGGEEIALLVFCLAKSADAFNLSESGKFAEMLAAARKLLSPVPLDQLTALSEYCQDAINSATGQKKSDPAPVTAPVS